jgi:hypothetical protein
MHITRSALEGPLTAIRQAPGTFVRVVRSPGTSLFIILKRLAKRVVRIWHADRHAERDAALLAIAVRRTITSSSPCGG